MARENAYPQWTRKNPKAETKKPNTAVSRQRSNWTGSARLTCKKYLSLIGRPKSELRTMQALESLRDSSGLTSFALNTLRPHRAARSDASPGWVDSPVSRPELRSTYALSFNACASHDFVFRIDCPVVRNLHPLVYVPLSYALLGSSPFRKDLHNQLCTRMNKRPDTRW